MCLNGENQPNSVGFHSDLKCSRWCLQYEGWVIMSYTFAFIKLFQMQQLIQVSYNARSHPTLCEHSIEDYKTSFLLEHLMWHILSHSLHLNYIVSTLPPLLNATGIYVTDVYGDLYLRGRRQKLQLETLAKFSRRTNAREPSERKILQDKLWIPSELEGLGQRARRIWVHE